LKGRRKRQHYGHLTLLASLAFLLLSAEFLAAWREGDLAAHSTQSPCKICLTANALAAGNVGSNPLTVVPAPLDLTEKRQSLSLNGATSNTAARPRSTARFLTTFY
jgi:hypothetical protein